MGRDPGGRGGAARAQAEGRRGAADAALTPPAALCFDAFDTLVTLDDPAARLVAHCAEAGLAVPYELARAAFVAEATHYRRHSLRGADPDRLRELRRECAGILGTELARHVPHALSADALETMLLDSLDFRLTPGCREALDAVQARGVPMAVVSNWDCSLPEVLERVGIAGYFVQITASAVVGAEKPDPATWQPALAALGTPPERTWHLGDEPEADVAGARAAGLQPVLVGPAEPPAGVPHVQTLAELPGLLDLCE